MTKLFFLDISIRTKRNRKKHSLCSLYNGKVLEYLYICGNTYFLLFLLIAVVGKNANFTMKYDNDSLKIGAGFHMLLPMPLEYNV